MQLVCVALARVPRVAARCLPNARSKGVQIGAGWRPTLCYDTRMERLSSVIAAAILMLLAATPALVASAQTDGSVRDAIRGFILQHAGQAGRSAVNPANWPKPTVNATPFDTSGDVQLGDRGVNYFDLEINGSHPYLAWTEGATDGSGSAVEWHCAIDPNTGDLNPPDCKGFKAFETTDLNRGNVGTDSQGLYYVGANAAGEIYFVRPTGASTGMVTKLPTQPEPTRRAYYPSLLGSTSNKGYVAWIKNASVVGSGFNPRNAWVELQYIDISDPADIHIIERQNRPLIGFAPMDVAFMRWVQGEPALIYGSYTSSGSIELKKYNVQTGQSEFVTDDGRVKVDPFPFVYGNTEYLIPGLDYGPVNGVYTRPAGSQGQFTLSEVIVTPAQTELAQPFLAEADKAIFWHHQVYTAYEVADRGGSARTGFFQAVGSRNGEIWLSTVGRTPQQQWRLSASNNNLVKTEPKPFIGNNAVYVFYSATPLGSDIMHATWQLHRAATPLGTSARAAP